MSKTSFFREMWSNDEGQDIAEYAVMLAVILVIVVGTIRLIGGNANNVFSSVASSLHARRPRFGHCPCAVASAAANSAIFNSPSLVLPHRGEQYFPARSVYPAAFDPASLKLERAPFYLPGRTPLGLEC